jgi:P-type E1-E2 ATPase
MIRIDIPGRGVLEIQYLLLDVNGTLSLDGEMIEGVAERIEKLRDRVEILIVTADTQGTAEEIAAALEVKLQKIGNAGQQKQKLGFVEKLGAETTAAIGNGANDALMLKAAALGICVAGPEGASSETIGMSDVIVPDIWAALDLLLMPKRLIATLRT